MTTLTPQQIAALQAKVTAGDITGFYTDLESYGDPYGTVGREVTTNTGWQAKFSNAFVASAAEDDSVDMSYGSTAWTALNKALAQAYLTAYSANGGVTPDGEAVQTIHNDAYVNAGLDEDDWLPNKPMNDSGDPDTLWGDFVVNQGGADLWDDAFDVAAAGAGIALNPWFLIAAIDDPVLMDKVRFANNFYNALAEMSPATLQDMLTDFAGNGPVADLLDFLIDLPGRFGGLLGKLPDAIGDILPQGLAGWVPGVYGPFGNSENMGSPLVLDADASGTIELAALNGTGSVYWDIDSDGYREASGWITGGDGLLAIDLNSDGIVSGHNELFGSQTGTITNGFVALDAYDTNNDNAITSADAQFGDLLVWIDDNADGYSQTNELHTLTDLGITSISTSYSNVNYSIAGNAIKQQGTFTMNGVSRTIVDAWFSYDNVNTEYAADYTLDVRTLFLPELRGYGTLPDLHIAMSEDETLLEMVQGLALMNLGDLLDPAFDLQGEMRAIMHRWAESDGINPTSRGIYIDARDLVFLERFVGEPYLQGGTSPNPGGPGPAAELMYGFQNARDAFLARVLLQSAAATLFDSKPVYDPDTDSFGGSPSLNMDAVEALIDDLDLDGVDLVNTWIVLFRLFDEAIGLGNFSAPDEAALDAIVADSSTTYDLTFSMFENAIFSTSSSMSGDAAANLMVGHRIAQTQYGYAGRDILYGNDGNDVLYGGNDGDLLVGGPGSDTLQGEAGDDDYVFSPGDGVSGSYDTVYETAGQGTDRIIIEGVNPADVRMWTTAQGHLYIQYGVNDQIQIAGSTGTLGETLVPDRVERIVFDDGTVWDLTQGLHLIGTDNPQSLWGSALSDTLEARGGTNEELRGYGGNDILIGGTGYENLYGGTGNDDYVFSVGDGVSGGMDSVHEMTGQGTDRIVLHGVDPDDVRMWTVSGGHLHIRYSATDEIRISAATGTSGESLAGSYVEQIVFDDSTVWDLTQGLHLIDTDDVHTLYGTAFDDTIEGRGGGEYHYGYGGNDTLIGGDGNDNLFGGAANDNLSGQAGIDSLYGEAGADIFLFVTASAFSNVDTIKDFSLAQNDAIDISDLLIDFDPLTDAITDFVQITTSGSNSSVFVDRDGTAGTYGLVQIATVQGVTGLTDEQALYNNGHLLAA